MSWQVFTLPFNETYVENLKFTPKASSQPGNFFKAEFQLTATGDTYIDVSQWEKGLVWVNGHNLGRYWNIGPQKELYCPAPWLKKGKNEIVVFDMHLLIPKTIKGVRNLQ